MNSMDSIIAPVERLLIRRLVSTMNRSLAQGGKNTCSTTLARGDDSYNNNNHAQPPYSSCRSATPPTSATVANDDDDDDDKERGSRCCCRRSSGTATRRRRNAVGVSTSLRADLRFRSSCQCCCCRRRWQWPFLVQQQRRSITTDRCNRRHNTILELGANSHWRPERSTPHAYDRRFVWRSPAVIRR
jgi:hypothetical protein